MIVEYVASSALALLLVSPVMRTQEFHIARTGETNVENFLKRVFFTTGSVGSVTLRGTCEASQDGLDVISDTLADPPAGTFKSLAEVLSALSKADPHISWMSDKHGLMRVRDDRVSGDLLRIHVKRVHIEGRVFAKDAIRDIMAAPEVRAYLAEKNIEEGSVFEHLVPASTKGLPTLSTDLSDLTVAQALDRVMQFFAGVWIYSECTSGSLERVLVRGVVSR